MPTNSTKRALIVLAVLLALTVAALGTFYYWQRRPLPPMISAVPGVPISGPEPDILSALPSDAPVIAYADVAALRKLQNSPLAAVLGLTSPGPQADREYANFVRETGFDYERDLDRAGIALWPAGFGTPANVLGEDRVISIAASISKRSRLTLFGPAKSRRTARTKSSKFPGVRRSRSNFYRLRASLWPEAKTPQRFSPRSIPGALRRATPPCNRASNALPARRFSP